MDSVVHSAVEEICSQGANGLALLKWPKFESSPLPRPSLLRQREESLWTNLLNIPGIQFESGGVSYDSQDSAIQSFQYCEEMDLKIVAVEHLRNSYVGICDINASDAGISLPQRRALERLIIAREIGITQSELAKEFGMKANNIFYILRNLECRGLIVRQSKIFRRKETFSDRETKNSSIVITNMLHLNRYAKHLGFQQRLEITKEDESLAGSDNEESAASKRMCI